MADATAIVERRTGPRRRWQSQAIIAGFVAIGTSTAALMLAYVLANGAADSQGNILQRWLWELTNNQVVGFSSGRPAYAVAIHVILGIVWALVYARFIEWNRGLDWWVGHGPGWSRGMRFAILPWLVSLLVLLPAAMINMLDWALSAGPLVPVGNLVLHLIYGYTLGALYDVSADEPAMAADELAPEEPLQRVAVAQSEDLSATGIVVGAVVGAAVGAGLAIVLPPLLPNVDFSGWSVALAVGGILAGGAVGGIVGSFAGLPQPPDPPDLESGPDPFQHNVLPFLIPPFLIVVLAGIVSTLGTSLLQVGKSDFEVGGVSITKAVVLAIAGIAVIGFGALFLASRPDQSSPSSRDTVSHNAEH
jgi:hypothetical protein